MECKHFPIAAPQGNPAIRIFGNRFFIDQSPTELLVELLLVVTSAKRIGGGGRRFSTPLPERDALSAWGVGQPLSYEPKARLNLKLFAFMASSRLDSRHAAHREHYGDLINALNSRITVADDGSKSEVLRTLENLFLGFHGAGGGRTWCAQSFLPVCPTLVAAETIWAESAAGRQQLVWADVLRDISTYFITNKHTFLARGGEVLYLQVCNALKQPRAAVREWAEQSKVGLSAPEQDPGELHQQLQTALTQLLRHVPDTLNEIAEFIDAGVESETAAATDTQNGDTREVGAGSCASESWQEGYLFAVELLRLCRSQLDVIERLQLLELACGMQVLRSLAAQSARLCRAERATTWQGYLIALSAPAERSDAIKRISRQTAKVTERLIYHAIRVYGSPTADTKKRFTDADRRYGGKLFVAVAKRIGLMIPRRGAGARFTLNEKLLRFLVITTVPIAGRLTYEHFKTLVTARHGLVVDADGLSRANHWTDGVTSASLSGQPDEWLQGMLSAAGLLIPLSDSCSLVRHPTAEKGPKS